MKKDFVVATATTSVLRTGNAAERNGSLGGALGRALGRGLGRAVTTSPIDSPAIEVITSPKEKIARRKRWGRVFRTNRFKKVHDTEEPGLNVFPLAEGLEQSRLTEKERIRDAAENWHRIVEQYSALKLTKQTDRLPALSGLAVRSSPALGKYLAGLWKKALVSDLMWRVNLLEVGIGRASEYISPSWSWASISGPVTYWTEAENQVPKPLFNRYKAHVRENLLERVKQSSFSGKVEVSGTNPYGRIRSGTLIVDGFLKPARLLWVSTRTGGIIGVSAAKVEPVPLKYDLAINWLDPAPDDAASDLVTGGERGDGYSDGCPYLELPFFADYILREDGPHQIPDFGLLTLLLIHPSICLVLRTVEYQPMTFRRVGIVRQPWGQVSMYGVDWMLGSEFKKGIRIV
ncbi:hypothetical protein DL771_004106 [Monosporascus sp. 5C6A]|nr:hypothetical protein DL771_004106 [Monosporascus sp. 5C6A]